MVCTNKQDRRLNDNQDRRSCNRKAAGVLYDNYNGDWTAFLHPGVLTEMYVYNIHIP